VMLGLQNEREWAVFCDKVLMRPDLKNEPKFSSSTRRSDARKELHAIIVGAFSGLTYDEVVVRLDDAKIGNAAMNDMQQVWDHAQLKARNRWEEIDTPLGKIKAMLPPGMPDSFEPRMDPVPAVGEHTDAILGELGYSDSDVQRLHDAQTV
jgi:itaconate CoA-transferase